MDDGEGGLSFDFENGLDVGSTHPTASVPAPQQPSPAPPPQTAEGGCGTGGGRRSFRQTVCRHWLRSLCMKGDACGFLHQYDKSRMPVCRFFRLYGECREKDCVYKHTNEDIKECNMSVHDSAYEKNPDEQVQSTVVSDDLNPPKPEEYWAPNPKTGVFGPASDQNPSSGGEGGPHASASEESVLEKKAFFRPLEDLDKPDQA